MLRPLLRKLHSDGTKRDRAGNRKLFYDHYVTLLLLYYFRHGSRTRVFR
jgi:hypothetical protein